jgi:cation/acetate symporter
MVIGTLATVLLIYLSPTIQTEILGYGTAWFPLRNPALVTIPLSFLGGIIVSLLLPEPAAAASYRQVERRMHLGELHER